MAFDSAFQGAGRNPGLELWRIEKKVPVKQTEITGKFHTGDSYILLSTVQTKSGKSWNIHFWLGSETSQDEAGIAAYKSVELDEALGGAPVQYREVQGYESDLFLSYFKSTGIEYLPGGVESGFVHVERDTYRPRLLLVKGKRVVRVKEVTLSNNSLNTGDVFILDLGLKLFVYYGAQANRREKTKALETLQRINDNERGARAEIVIVNEDPMNTEFWQTLGGYIEVTNTGDDDEVAERKESESIRLFHVSDQSGALQTTEITTEGKLKRELLQSSDSYILDSGDEIFVWIGGQSDVSEKREAMNYAQQYLVSRNRPPQTRITRVFEGSETPIFKGLFDRFDPPVAFQFGSVRRSSVRHAEEKEIDVSSLHLRQQKEDVPIDNGEGRLQIWRVENFQKVAWPENLYGQFFAGDSYILLYTYQKGLSEEYIIYFWQGRDSSQDEIGASAILAAELDRELGDRPVQVRVVMGKEPSHFRTLFKGKMIIHSGGKASSFKNRHEHDSYDVDGVSLFQIKGTNALNTHAVQVPEKAAHLNSGDCFVLLTPVHIYSWYGRFSNPDERRVAHNVAEIILRQSGVNHGSLVEIVEESETDEFWSFLGGKSDYSSFSEPVDVCNDPRLFQISNSTGRLVIEEVCNFTQDDLADDDVFLLDVFSSVFIWIGSQANETEKQQSLKVAEQYISSSTDGRDPQTPVVIVHAGAEPIIFTQHFLGWDAELTHKNKFIDPYEARLAEIKNKKDETPDLQGTVTMEDIKKKQEEASHYVDASSITQFVSLNDLQNNPPSFVDPKCKELYLSDQDFLMHIGVTKVEFAKYPKWKQQEKKKALRLF